MNRFRSAVPVFIWMRVHDEENDRRCARVCMRMLLWARWAAGEADPPRSNPVITRAETPSRRGWRARTRTRSGPPVPEPERARATMTRPQREPHQVRVTHDHLFNTPTHTHTLFNDVTVFILRPNGMHLRSVLFMIMNMQLSSETLSEAHNAELTDANSNI